MAHRDDTPTGESLPALGTPAPGRLPASSLPSRTVPTVPFAPSERPTGTVAGWPLAPGAGPS